MYLYRNMRFKEIEGGYKVFDYGDKGDLFYIIMEGEVIIKTPAMDVLEDEQATPEGLLIYIVEYFQELQWDKIPDGEHIR